MPKVKRPTQSKAATKAKTATKSKAATKFKTAKTAIKSKSAAKLKKTSTSKKITKKTPIKKTTARSSKQKVSSTPKGCHSVIPYLIVDGAAQAIEFYKKAFGAKVGLKMEQPGGKIGHAELKIGDSKIMLSDECPEVSARGPKAYGGTAVGIQLYVKNVDKVVERAVAEGAKLTRPVENMFYGDRLGLIEDQFGHKWQISTHIEDVSTRELKKRAAQLYGKK